MTAPRFRIVIKIGRWVLAIGIGEQIRAVPGDAKPLIRQELSGDVSRIAMRSRAILDAYCRSVGG
jgi:hypothetical protein